MSCTERAAVLGVSRTAHLRWPHSAEDDGVCWAAEVCTTCRDSAATPTATPIERAFRVERTSMYPGFFVCGHFLRFSGGTFAISSGGHFYNLVMTTPATDWTTVAGWSLQPGLGVLGAADFAQFGRKDKDGRLSHP